RGLLSGGGQRRHAQACRPRARHGAGSGGAVPGRTFGRAGPDQLAPARRSDPRAARQSGRHGGNGHARAPEHFRDRQQLGFPRPGDQEPARDGRSARIAGQSAGPQGGTFSDPQRRRACRLAGARRPIQQKGDDRMKRANPAVVGGFVVGAVVLVVIGLLVFGGIGWFAQTNTYIAYFPGSVKGLQVGAPVDFRGVTIGEVKEIRVLFDPAQVSARIPVIMELDPTQIDVIGGREVVTQPEDADQLLEAGLAAQLQLQSLLTGLLFVNLDFYPEAQARLVGGEQPYPEIPTIPSDLEQLQERAGDVAARLPDLLDQLNGLLAEANRALGQTSEDFSSIVSDLA